MNSIASAFVRTLKSCRFVRFPACWVLIAGGVVPLTPAFGQLANGLSAALIIHDESGAPDTTLDLSGWIRFDATTGIHSLVAPGTSLGTSGWKWAQNATVPIPGTESTTTSTVLQWGQEDRATVSILDVQGKIDPFMTYSLAVKNNTAVTQTYTFVFGESIVPTITGDYTVQADVGVSLSTTTPAATVAPVGLAPKFQLLQLSADNGATSFNAGVDVGTTLSRATNGTSTMSEASSLINGTTLLVLNYWEFRTSFTLTPGGDAVGISGFAEITPIPEPATYSLGVGALVLGLVARRRWRPAPRA
ncbi:MAG: PEP-CTERM sorting domain-containing protein [Verrucomicrobiota bacterium]